MQFTFIPTNSFAVLGKAIANLAQASFERILSPNDEVKVWQKSDRFGNFYWCAYDPKTGDSANFGSEIEVMGWIESHYYSH
jgi:hypothetical protein